MVSTSIGHTIVFDKKSIANEIPPAASEIPVGAESTTESTNENIIISNIDKVNEQ